jgi:hypothetical protein
MLMRRWATFLAPFTAADAARMIVENELDCLEVRQSVTSALLGNFSLLAKAVISPLAAALRDHALAESMSCFLTITHGWGCEGSEVLVLESLGPQLSESDCTKLAEALLPGRAVDPATCLRLLPLFRSSAALKNRICTGVNVRGMSSEELISLLSNFSTSLHSQGIRADFVAEVVKEILLRRIDGEGVPRAALSLAQLGCSNATSAMLLKHIDMIPRCDHSAWHQLARAALLCSTENSASRRALLKRAASLVDTMGLTEVALFVDILNIWHPESSGAHCAHRIFLRVRNILLSGDASLSSVIDLLSASVGANMDRQLTWCLLDYLAGVILHVEEEDLCSIMDLLLKHEINHTKVIESLHRYRYHSAKAASRLVMLCARFNCGFPVRSDDITNKIVDEVWTLSGNEVVRLLSATVRLRSSNRTLAINLLDSAKAFAECASASQLFVICNAAIFFQVDVPGLTEAVHARALQLATSSGEALK